MKNKDNKSNRSKEVTPRETHWIIHVAVFFILISMLGFLGLLIFLVYMQGADNKNKINKLAQKK